jgi:hypothetical protein
MYTSVELDDNPLLFLGSNGFVTQIDRQSCSRHATSDKAFKVTL